MNKKELDLLDNNFWGLDPSYPTKGTFLEKINFVQMKQLSISDKEKSELMQRAQAEGENGFKRYLQYIFSLYPYEG